MDSLTAVDIVELTRTLVDIDSTTGREGECGRRLAAYLRERGYSVTEQPVDDSRFNVLAGCGTSSTGPSVVFSTHFDCVPPFFPSRVEGDRLYGRGSCDAKGILAAQIAAADRLRAAGESRVGLVFVVGEERGSDGAVAANRAAPADCRFLVNGEPTDNRLGLATRGILRVRLRASGRASHSSYPELGESAIEKLIDALVRLRAIELPSDATLGRTHYSVGLISGGVAPNVIPPAAEAEVMFRTVGDFADVRRAIEPLERPTAGRGAGSPGVSDRGAGAPGVTIEHVLDVPPVALTTVPGIDAAVFPYTTDIPFLAGWGKPLLFGPGSVHAAHTADESVSITELHQAVDYYVAIARDLLGRA